MCKIKWRCDGIIERHTLQSNKKLCEKGTNQATKWFLLFCCNFIEIW